LPANGDSPYSSNGSEPAGPPFPVGRPTSSWREHALARLWAQRGLGDWFEERDPTHATELATVRGHLASAEQAARGDCPDKWRERVRASLGGSMVERAMSNLDAAESELLRLAPEDYVRGQMPNLVAHVRGHLAADDPRRELIERIAARKPEAPLTDSDREAIVTAVRIASLESRSEVTRVRSFRNVLFVTAFVLTLVAAGVVVLGALRPDVLPLCFNPGDQIVCATSAAPVDGGVAEGARAPSQTAVDDAARATASSWDIPLVALVGLIAAAVAAAAALRNIRGTTTPYSLPIALAVLKLPTGALTAVLGLLLMRGEFVPGLSALDSPAQIISWAIVLGYAQQLLTGMVDRRAQDVLDDVGGGGNRPPADPSAAAVARPA
jgi:hypothetical protein